MILELEVEVARAHDLGKSPRRLERPPLVDWLGFFNGRRLVPIIMAFVGIVMGVFFGLVWSCVL